MVLRRSLYLLLMFVQFLHALRQGKFNNQGYNSDVYNHIVALFYKSDIQVLKMTP